MRVSTPTHAYHHGDLAAALEAAALELLREQRASSLSLREVARRAGVSHNAPYHHFGDRRGLLRSIAAHGLRDLHAAMAAARDGAGSDPRDRLLAIGRAYVDFALERSGQFDAIFDPEICDPRDPDPAVAQLIAANDELIRDATRAMLPRASDDEVAAAAASLWGTVHGLSALVSAGHLPREVVPVGLASMLRIGEGG